jgi:hypothetical protein
LGSVKQNSFHGCASTEGLKNLEAGIKQKNIFEFVDGDEKFGIEFKASLNKTATHSPTANAVQFEISKNPRV